MSSADWQDLDDFLVISPIRLPIGGKTYSFPGSLSGRSGLLLQRIGAASAKAALRAKTGTKVQEMSDELLSDAQEIDLRTEIMGDTEAELIADDVPAVKITHVFRTLMTWHMAGEAAAKEAWTSLGEAPAPSRAARRASRESAKSTRSQGSTSTTSTPARTRKPAGPGRKSSPASP